MGKRSKRTRCGPTAVDGPPPPPPPPPPLEGVAGGKAGIPPAAVADGDPNGNIVLDKERMPDGVDAAPPPPMRESKDILLDSTDELMEVTSSGGLKNKIRVFPDVFVFRLTRSLILFD
jgi:hypothetical protein